MRRTTITLPDDLAELAEREATRKGTSLSEVVRSALRQAIGVTEQQPSKLPIAALGRSGKRHTARNAEKILAREWDRAGGR